MESRKGKGVRQLKLIFDLKIDKYYIMERYIDDDRIILTLDAGGTHFLFSAIRSGREIVNPVRKKSDVLNLEHCIMQIKEGFHSVIAQLHHAPSAISFAFPGPADYPRGIIGDLPNFPCFKGGVPLGLILEEEFNMPVFINNDGSLFAYGEALAGTLPEVNRRLCKLGSHKRFRHLIGVTLGTGFGCGVVLDGHLLVGDNATGGSIWCLRNKKYHNLIVEESVSIRAVQRVYATLSNDTAELTPKDIFEIAEGNKPGNQAAAISSFCELGEMAGDALASAVTLIDGIIVIGGGLAGASKYILPSLIRELNGRLCTFDEKSLPRLSMKAYDLTDESVWEEFAKGEEVVLTIPGGTRVVTYDPVKRIGVMVSKQDASHSIAMGAYIFALSELDKMK